MSALLDIVAELADVRRTADAEFKRAVVRAKTQHSLTEIGRAAGLTKQRISVIVKQAREESTKCH